MTYNLDPSNEPRWRAPLLRHHDCQTLEIIFGSFGFFEGYIPLK